MDRLVNKLHEIGMSSSEVAEFVRLKSEIDGLWDKPGFATGSNRQARNRRYDRQQALLNKYKVTV